jgi:hypothetical protein
VFEIKARRGVLVAGFLLVAALVAGCAGATETEAGETPGPGPEVQFLLPQSLWVRLPVVLRATGQVQSAEFEIDGTVVASDAEAPFEYLFDPKQHSEGSHEVAISVVLTSGGTRRASVTVTVTHSPVDPPIDEDLSPIELVILGQAPGTWLEIPNSRLENFAFPTPSPGGDLANGIIEPWCGGAWDDKRKRLWIWGGGHADSGANHLMAFNLRRNGIWEMVQDTETNVGICVPWTPSGRPSASHSYYACYWNPLEPDYYIIGPMVSAWCDRGGGSRHSDFAKYHVPTDTWSGDGDYYDYPGDGNMLDDRNATDLHPVTGIIYTARSPRVKFDPVTGEFEEKSGTILGPGKIDPVRNLMVSVYEFNQKIYFTDLSGDDWNVAVEKTPSGDTDFITVAGQGMAYDPVSGYMVGWRGGSAVYLIDTDPSAANPRITKVFPNSFNTVTPGALGNGVFGRWQSLAYLDAFLLVNHAYQNVVVYKPDRSTWPD